MGGKVLEVLALEKQSKGRLKRLTRMQYGETKRHQVIPVAPTGITCASEVIGQ